MDKIAGVVGFYDPIFGPALHRHSQESLTLEHIEAIRVTYCPIASFQATLVTCVQRIDEPAIYVEAGLGYKKDEGKKVYSDQLSFLPVDLPEAKLRVLQANPNAAAKAARLRIDRNMEVPAGSLIARLYSGRPGALAASRLAGVENLSNWTHSDGSTLDNRDVWIDGKQIGNRVLAIVKPFYWKSLEGLHHLVVSRDY